MATINIDKKYEFLLICYYYYIAMCNQFPTANVNTTTKNLMEKYLPVFPEFYSINLICNQLQPFK